MSTRTLANLYNTAARLWLVAAGAALLLPVSARLGNWLPLHLALAGAVSVAISGNMMSFAAALTATRVPAPAVAWIQFGLVDSGATLIAVGYPRGHPALVAAGGACFVGSLLIVLGVVANAWRTGLNRRHPLPMALYGVAVCFALAGGTLGAVLGSGAVEPSRLEALRDAHLTLNVLGWASITIVATLMTLLPTVLRIRMPWWNAPAAAACLVGGLGLLAGGLATGARVISTGGAALYWAGGIQVAVMVARGLAGPRNWPVPVTAKHMVGAVSWFVCGGAALVVACARGSFDAFVPVLEVVFVCGWVLQTLIGSWLYLLPVSRPGGPVERRVWFTAVEVGADVQVAAANLGLALLALAVAGALPSAAGTIGAAVAIAAAAFALVKSWTYPTLGQLPAMRRASEERWNRRA